MRKKIFIHIIEPTCFKEKPGFESSPFLETLFPEESLKLVCSYDAAEVSKETAKSMPFVLPNHHETKMFLISFLLPSLNLLLTKRT